jgi:hypothetical protein
MHVFEIEQDRIIGSLGNSNCLPSDRAVLVHLMDSNGSREVKQRSISASTSSLDNVRISEQVAERRPMSTRRTEQ